MNVFFEDRRIIGNKKPSKNTLVNVACACGEIYKIRNGDYKAYMPCINCMVRQLQGKSTKMNDLKIKLKHSLKILKPIIISIGIGVISNIVWQMITTLTK
jgi:hypothetical protein